MPRYSPRTGALETYQVGPFDSTHLYVQWGGKLPGGESWTCGFRMWKAGGATEADGAAHLVNVAAALSAWHTRAESGIGAQAKFSFVKVNAIGLDGKYIGDGANEATFADLAGGGGASSMPNQVALVIGLTTGFTRGVAHRGRFYSPLPALPLDTDGRLLPAVRDMVKGSAATLRTNVNAASTTGFVMAVMSRKAGAPGHRAVTGVEVGRVLDTQRRRRRNLAEAYV